MKYILWFAILMSIGLSGYSFQHYLTKQEITCKDGTISKSKSHSGTCSHHGGVLRWSNP